MERYMSLHTLMLLYHPFLYFIENCCTSLLEFSTFHSPPASPYLAWDVCAALKVLISAGEQCVLAEAGSGLLASCSAASSRICQDAAQHSAIFSLNKNVLLKKLFLSRDQDVWHQSRHSVQAKAGLSKPAQILSSLRLFHLSCAAMAYSKTLKQTRCCLVAVKR